MSKKPGMTHRDEEVAMHLFRAGYPKNVARSLAYLLRVHNANSRDIELATGLRQPEVSIAMQKLRKIGWVKKDDVRKKGKGRPTHSYSLEVKPGYIIKQIEADESKKMRDIKDNILELKKLVR